MATKTETRRATSRAGSKSRNRSQPKGDAPKGVQTKRKATARKPAVESAEKPRAKQAGDSGRGWVRSPATYQAILEATIDCFVEIGYERTTTTEIAKKAGFTRGAVQYYFPTTAHALEASIRYLVDEWLDEYMTAAREAPIGADFIDYAVDTLWRFVNNKLFVAWQELLSASRTHPELRSILKPAAAKFERLRRDMGRENFRDFYDANSVKFQRNRDTLRFVLEGMTTTMITFDKKERIQAQLDWLKEWFHASWQEELKAKKVAARRKRQS